MMTAIEVARGQVGVRETPGAKNRGPMIDRFNNSVHQALGSPWCAAFVSWCFMKCGAVGLPMSGGSQAWKAWAKAKGLLFKDPQHLLEVKGAVAGWTNPEGHGHLFFVEERRTGLVFKRDKVLTIGTIEGNTNLAGHRDGDGCYRRIRRVPVDGGHSLWFIDVGSWVQGAWWD